MIETIESFCDRHGACDDDKKWALKNCVTMNDVWECAKPNWLVWVATRPGVLDDKTLRMFIFWCIRWVLRFINNKCRNAGFVVEKFVIADATKADFAAAWAATCAAARAAARKDQAKWLRENAKPNFEVVLKKSGDEK